LQLLSAYRAAKGGAAGGKGAAAALSNNKCLRLFISGKGGAATIMEKVHYKQKN
jgi:hypothetical protein